jgi:hypothetical protein
MNGAFKTFPKQNPVRSPKYLRVVAQMECAHCGLPGYSQAAHADQGKGMGIKGDDRYTYPACAPRPGVPGCHMQIGTLAMYDKEQRRDIERIMVAATMRKVEALGLWPLGVEKPNMEKQ